MGFVWLCVREYCAKEFCEPYCEVRVLRVNGLRLDGLSDFRQYVVENSPHVLVEFGVC